MATSEEVGFADGSRGRVGCSLQGIPCRRGRELLSELTSVFDLSPAEKLQLVEDLWDDLAATPAVIPVHDWQKDELPRRKERLHDHPPLAISWEDMVLRVRRRAR